MNDKLHSALRELETHAPDIGDTRAAVYRGIDTRARRKRIATTVAAAACVAGVAVPAAVLLDGDQPTGQVAAPDRSPSRLVPVTKSATVELPVTLPPPAADETRGWNVFRGDVDVTMSSPTTGMSAILFSREKLDDEDDISGPPLSEDPVTVNGRDAVRYTYENPYRDGLVHLQWRQSGVWVRVMAESAERVTALANDLRDTPSRATAPVRFTVRPPGFEPGDSAWGEEKGWTTMCEPSGPDEPVCFTASDRTASELPRTLRDGPEPAGRCDDNAVPTDSDYREPTFGQARRVDGKSVRLSSDGCWAVLERERVVLHSYDGADLSLDDFARMAAAIEVDG